MSTQTDWRIPRWTLGDRLRKAREERGVSQGEMAEILDVNRNTVGNYEAGRTSPSNLAMRAWALRTGVPFEWLKEGVEPGDGGPDGGQLLPRLDSNQEPAGHLRPLTLVA